MTLPGKFATLSLSFCCAVGVLAGCSQETAPATEATPEPAATPAEEAAPEPAAAPAEEATPEPAAAPAEPPTTENESMTALERGRAFLAENAKRAEVVTTASGLQYEVLASGTGEMPSAEDQVTAHYHGTLIDGAVFDSSVQRGQPLDIRVNGVIAGWQEALQMMRVGDKWKLYVPSELAYGKAGAGGAIGPDEALIFEVELLAVASS